MEEGQNNQEIDNVKKIEDFFQKNASEIKQNIHPDDTKSKEEEQILFSGNLEDIDVWLKHEQFRLDFREFELKHKEFKLKKSTLLSENQIKQNDSESERKLREKNAELAFKFSAIWASFVGVFVIFHGFGECLNFKISETEFMFVCGTLTTSILIFYLTVIKNLFPNKNKES